MIRPSCLLLIFSFVLFGQNPEATKPVIVKSPVKHTPAWSGAQMFQSYCAACHGVEAKGNGPAAPALKAAVPDLTTIAKRNGGKYPDMKIVSIIKGDPEIAAHGSKDMPVWGTLLRSNNATDNEQALRIRNLTEYIGTLQKK